MTDTTTQPEHRELTYAELTAEATERFGPNPEAWAFQCPTCGDIAVAADFPDKERHGLGQECVGRHVEGRGCKRAAYGFIPGPWQIAMPDGSTLAGFPLAPVATGGDR